MIKEFKKFIMRGNVLDLAVGVIIGGAFGKIVSSVVSDIFMPVISLIFGQRSFENRFILLGNPPAGVEITTAEQAAAADIPTLNYGVFLINVIDFIIIAVVVFLIIKGINKLSDVNKHVLHGGKKSAPDAPTTKECPYCMTLINIKASRCPQCTSELEKA